MKILLLGAGLQGRAALHDLLRSPDVEQVVVADLEIDRARAAIPELADARVVCETLDAHDEVRAAGLMRSVDAVIHLLPAPFRLPMARLAVESGVHFVDASYADPQIGSLHRTALDKGVAILPEFGLDPGLDLVLTGLALREFDEIHELHSYGAGIPEPSAAGNPLKYKISWSFAGVLGAYTRSARRIRGGQVEEVPGADLFAPANVHTVHVNGLGDLEAYPNGDAVKYVAMLGLSGSVREAGRYSMRWPGHSETWRTLISLGLLSDEPIRTGGLDVVPRRFLHDLLLPQLQYGPQERDIALILLDVHGMQAGRSKRIVFQVLDYRDLETGLLAMQRTVGFTASIGAQMLVRGEIPGRGLLSPLRDVPAEPLFAALGRRGILVQRVEQL